MQMKSINDSVESKYLGPVVQNVNDSLKFKT